MIELIGNMSLSLAVIVAAATILASIASIKFESIAILRAARWLLAIFAALITITAALLLALLLSSDFRFHYVASYTERALPWGYKFAALWAGQEGSLLLWAWLLSVMCVIAAFNWRKCVGPMHATALGVLAAVSGFFAVLLLYTSNPFRLIEGGAPIDGRGLNPQLQDIGMIIHPPLLFTGYAGFAVPFAMLIGALIFQPQDNRWLSLIRRWVLFSWMFLGAGIVLGAWWAYVELGWGGYWAWDPVENASLLPWLTSTALLHSIIVQQHRGMFRIWNACLLALTFILCIFGTYLTRSGVIDSVHAFAASLLGRFFLVFLLMCIAASAALIIWRLRLLKSNKRLEGLVSREGAFLTANVLLMIMMATTLVGTIFPLLSGLFVAQPVTVKAEFYNRIVAPMGIGLVGLMAFSPVLAFGVQAARKIAHSLTVPGAIALIITLGVVILWTRNIWALACVAIVALGTGAVVVDFARSFSARRRSTGEPWLTCSLLLIDKDHRRYGGQLSHLGVMTIVIGVAASSLFSHEIIARLSPDQTVTVDGQTLRFVSIKDVRHANFSAVQATIELTDRSGHVHVLTPQRRFYDAWMEQPSSEVAVRSTWREDVYLSLAGWEASGEIAALQVKINPLVPWIWVGGILMTLGAMFCLLPRLLPRLGHNVVSESGTAWQPAISTSPEPIVSRAGLTSEAAT